MLMLTTTAADVIKGLSDAPGAGGLRISTLEEGAGGLQASLAAGPEETDHVIEAEGARLFLTAEAADALEDKVLDADVQGGEIRFALLEQQEEG